MGTKASTARRSVSTRPRGWPLVAKRSLLGYAPAERRRTTMTGCERVSFVIPVKSLESAKSRLGLPDRDRRRVALRLATSTVRAALDSSSVGLVIVVTSDLEIVEATGCLGAVTVPEPALTGLNCAARLGRRRALTLRPTSPVSILVADLPRLHPHDLDAAVAQFRQVGAPMAVADQHGTGTTMLIHGPQDSPEIRFGNGSAAAHANAGFRAATGSLLGLRSDLDLPADLVGLQWWVGGGLY
jgi:2-phospho-L-lactate guanylyltransferase